MKKKNYRIIKPELHKPSTHQSPPSKPHQKNIIHNTILNEKILSTRILIPRKRGSSYNQSTHKNTKNHSHKKYKPRDLIKKEIDADYKISDEKVNRAWYSNESGVVPDESNGPIFIGDEKEFKNFEEDLDNIKKAEKTGKIFKKRKSQKVQALEKDQAKWEENRIRYAGVGKYDKIETRINEDESNRVNILVLDFKPAFLSGKTVYTKQQDSVSVVKDPLSDLAIIAKKGSLLLQEIRTKQERKAAMRKFWDTANSKSGNVPDVNNVSLKIEKESDVTKKEESNYDYKSKNSFTRFHKMKISNSSNFSKKMTIRQQKEFLPIYGVKASLLQLIHDHQIVVIVGETGSGKTTQLTQYLLEEYTDYGIIGCTQPRRVAAMSVAKRVSREYGCKIGSTIGYSIRFEDCTSKETKVKYLTDGVLLRESLKESDLDAYSVIIMDEAHERSLHTDILFGILRSVCQRRADLKLIITSATLNASQFSNYFGGVPIYKVPGRTFPVEIFYSKSVCQDYLESAVKQILTIHLSHDKGDILVFMTGQEDIEATCAVTAQRITKLDNVKPLLILPIYSQLPSDLQARIFQKSPNGERKCIVATNIAETSLTVDGIKYVIDAGYCKLKVYNPKMGMDSLQVTPISRANADQRSGRAGRTAPGYAYRLYTNIAYNLEMLPNAVPEIQRTNLGNVVLLLKSLGINNLLEFKFMDPPPQETILNSMYQLWILGALDNVGNLTSLGREMAEFPLDPPLSKMLVYAVKLGCSIEILTIVSILSVQNIFFRPPTNPEESDSAREKFFVPESDHLTYLKVYQSWEEKEFSEDWCRDHFVHLRAMNKVREIRGQLLDIMNSRKLPIESCGFEYDRVRKAICSAYFHQAAKMKGIGEYANVRTRMPCFLHPSSSLYGLGFTPEYVVYHELIMTSREYMRTVTAVNPKWLAELGPMFFQIREMNAEKRNNLTKKLMEEQIRVIEKELEAKEIEAAEKRVKKEYTPLVNSRQMILMAGNRNRRKKKKIYKYDIVKSDSK